MDCAGYGFTVAQFQLHATMPWYGLWAVSNEWKDVSDLASIKEQRSYVLLERPYRFLQAIDKKSVDQETLGVTAAVRKQVPVLLDFNEGRVYIESSNKKLIYTIVDSSTVRRRDHPGRLDLYSRTGPRKFLIGLYEGTQYQGDFIKRADEATRFQPKEIEKLEDRELEAIVANYFSMTQLAERSLGRHLRSRADPAARHQSAHRREGPHYRDHATADDERHQVLSGAITFQERVSFTGKDGGERTFRKDLLCVDVNDRINLTDVGAAMLRGFDFPRCGKTFSARFVKPTRCLRSSSSGAAGCMN